MSIKILVCVKQVVDPETPTSAFKIDPDSKRVIPAIGIPPVVNGFDENAVEAALRIKDSNDAHVSVLSLGSNFALDVMKKPLSMGADELILIDDKLTESFDSYATAYVLVEAIKVIGDFDLILCGRQASDWDQAQVPMGISEMLGIPIVTLAQSIEYTDHGIIVEKPVTDGIGIFAASSPCLVSVSNELGEPRYPTLRGIMSASRKSPAIYTLNDLSIEIDNFVPNLELIELFVPEREQNIEFIEGENEVETGRNLALRLRDEQLI